MHRAAVLLIGGVLAGSLPGCSSDSNQAAAASGDRAASSAPSALSVPSAPAPGSAAPAPASATSVAPAGTAEPITADGVREHLEVLASDLLEGRLAGTLGERRAAEYIRTVLESIEGLEPGGDGGTWFQEFIFSRWMVPQQSRNVIALLPGGDPELAAETIVIGAHYDHEGPGGGAVYNGADDNASGSATLLELAAALAARPERPRRTLAFHWYGAEESGLEGSAHYVSHPLRPLPETVMMLNLDMVGRLRGGTLMVGATGSSPLFPLLLPGLCRRAGLVMKEEPRVSSNSDHWSFFRRGVPVLFLFTGFHDDYHKVSDEMARANAAGAARVGVLAQEIVLAIDAVDADERPAYVRAERGKERWTPKAWIGLTLGSPVAPPPAGADAAAAGSQRPAGGSLRVDEVEAGGPAERAGLRAGDVLLAVDGRPAQGYVALREALVLRDFEALPLRLLVERGAGAEGAGAQLELTVQPEVR